MEQFLNDLNPPQKEAVKSVDGPILIFAGAGSGKTRVLTYRIAYLIKEKGINPLQILAVTFTNKAADEMKERVRKILGFNRVEPLISTFHSFALRILRIHAIKLGYKENFVIFDEDDQIKVIKECMFIQGIGERLFTPQTLLKIIEDAKNSGITPDMFNPDPFNIPMKQAGVIYHLYQDKLKELNAMDFGDLILNNIILFERYPDILKTYQERFRYVLVDEYQDTNAAQYTLIQRLTAKHKNLCVVGDDDQSIYQWRGADIRNILQFEQDFPGAKIIKLEQNYRSTKIILNAANAIVKNNKGRKNKKLWTENHEGEAITCYIAENEFFEANYVAQKIIELREEGINFRDIAIFYRINAQSRVLEEEMVRLQIPYTIVGGFRFYERKEIKDILAYLRVIVNPYDSISLKRIINTPPRGIGKATLTKIENYSKSKGLSLYDSIKE
ncbi:MAG: ATP-dependent DNA helicase PcrA, partial [Spirochaetes bacterium]